MIKDIISAYAYTSGQEINFVKSLVCFSRNTSDEARHIVCDTLSVGEQPDLGHYLGLPTRIGLNKKQVFQFIKDRMWKKLNSWNQRCLSKARKEIMLKTILQTLPNYVVNLFLLSKTLCLELQKIINRFWWAKGIDHANGIHWMSWQRLSRPKAFRSLGFKRLQEFNLAIFGRHAWNIFTSPNSLVA